MADDKGRWVFDREDLSSSNLDDGRGAKISVTGVIRDVDDIEQAVNRFRTLCLIAFALTTDGEEVRRGKPLGQR